MKLDGIGVIDLVAQVAVAWPIAAHFVAALPALLVIATRSADRLAVKEMLGASRVTL